MSDVATESPPPQTPEDCPICGGDLIEVPPALVPANLWDVWGNAQQARVGLIRYACTACHFVIIDTNALALLSVRQQQRLAEGRAELSRRAEWVRRMDLCVTGLVAAAAFGLGVLIGSGALQEPAGAVLAGLLVVCAIGA